MITATMSFRASAALLLASLTLACTAATPRTETNVLPAPAVSAGTQDTLVPPGFGTLKQDEVTVSIRSGALLVKVTPLAESVIRLLAPDTYARLHGLVQNVKELTGATRAPELFLVSFFSYQPDISFQPQDVQLMHQGQLLRQVGVEALTTGWGRQRLQQQDNQTAIYAFEGPIDYNQQITLRYGMEESDAWRNVMPKLQAERNRVLSRASGGK